MVYILQKEEQEMGHLLDITLYHVSKVRVYDTS